jgi:HK97 family phage portal protein
LSIRTAVLSAWHAFRADVGGGVPSPDSDYWYHSRGFSTSAGAYVSPDSAMRLAAVFACVRVISETIGSLPVAIYRRRPDGGKERANEHPVYSVLQRPNTWQTGMEFWEMLQAHLELRGNAYAQIVSGPGRSIDQLIPLHPDRVKVYRLANGRLRYEVTSYFDGTTTSLAQEEMFHLRGMSSDGILGMSTISAGSEVIGTGLAQMEHRARYFSNSAIPGLAIKTANKLEGDKRKEFMEGVRQGFSGANAFKVMVLNPGMEASALGLTNKDSQLIEASSATRTDIASLFRLPPHKIGDLTRGTFSNIEQQNIEFATDSVRPRLVRLERRIDADLIDPLGAAFGAEPGDYFVAFDMDALLRGDIKSRYEAYNQALQYWLTVDEVRAMEGKNPMGGPSAELLRPVNMQIAGEPSPAAAPDTTDAGESADESGDTGDDTGGPQALCFTSHSTSPDGDERGRSNCSP